MGTLTEVPELDTVTLEITSRMEPPRLAELRDRLRSRFPLWMDPEEIAARLPEDALEVRNLEELETSLVSSDQSRVLWLGDRRLLLTHLSPWQGFRAFDHDALIALWLFREIAATPRRPAKVSLTVRVPTSEREADTLRRIRGLPNATELDPDEFDAMPRWGLTKATGRHELIVGLTGTEREDETAYLLLRDAFTLGPREDPGRRLEEAEGHLLEVLGALLRRAHRLAPRSGQALTPGLGPR